MSQNMPPNQPGQPDNGTAQEGGSYGYAGANPYYGQQQGGEAAAPNLDANAPMLKINYELGFKPYTSDAWWQIELDGVQQYLNSKEM